MRERTDMGGAGASRSTLHPSSRLRLCRMAACEAGKLLRSPALWAFLALCIAFNALLLTVNAPNASVRIFANETSRVAQELGQRIDDGFLSALAERAVVPNERALLEAARAAENVFDGYSAADLGCVALEKVAASPVAVQLMSLKYELLETRVVDLAEAEAALDVYAGPVTPNVHQFLFGSLAPALVAEAAMLGIFASLHLLGFEHRHRTATAVYSTAVGRRLQRVKTVLAAVVALAAYAMLCAVTLGAFFLQWDFGGLWNASVSSQFNHLVVDLVPRPFLTWADFTVASYLAMTLALGGALALSVTLLAAAVGILARNAYLAALSLALILMGALAARSVLANAGLWIASYLAALSPSGIWTAQPAWFTEAGSIAIVPWQEVIGVAAGLIMLITACVFSLRRFDRKDVSSCDC